MGLDWTLPGERRIFYVFILIVIIYIYSGGNSSGVQMVNLCKRDWGTFIIFPVADSFLYSFSPLINNHSHPPTHQTPPQKSHSFSSPPYNHLLRNFQPYYLLNSHFTITQIIVFYSISPSPFILWHSDGF